MKKQIEVLGKVNPKQLTLVDIAEMEKLPNYRVTYSKEFSDGFLVKHIPTEATMKFAESEADFHHAARFYESDFTWDNGEPGSFTVSIMQSNYVPDIIVNVRMDCMFPSYYTERMKKAHPADNIELAKVNFFNKQLGGKIKKVFPFLDYIKIKDLLDICHIQVYPMTRSPADIFKTMVSSVGLTDDGQFEVVDGLLREVCEWSTIIGIDVMEDDAAVPWSDEKTQKQLDREAKLFGRYATDNSTPPTRTFKVYDKVKDSWSMVTGEQELCHLLDEKDFVVPTPRIGKMAIGSYVVVEQ